MLPSFVKFTSIEPWISWQRIKWTFIWNKNVFQIVPEKRLSKLPKKFERYRVFHASLILFETKLCPFQSKFEKLTLGWSASRRHSRPDRLKSSSWSARLSSNTCWDFRSFKTCQSWSQRKRCSRQICRTSKSRTTRCRVSTATRRKSSSGLSGRTRSSSARLAGTSCRVVCSRRSST